MQQRAYKNSTLAGFVQPPTVGTVLAALQELLYTCVPETAEDSCANRGVIEALVENAFGDDEQEMLAMVQLNLEAG